MKMLAAQAPKPQYYQNYGVGECRDLIFGVSLVDYATANSLGEGEIPKIVRICIKEIDDRGLDAEGIYRVRNFYIQQDPKTYHCSFRCLEGMHLSSRYVGGYIESLCL